jgi:hypothetical protein
VSFGSPSETVNSVMEWLNSLFGLRIPLLPLSGWPEFFRNLWRKFVAGPLPDPKQPLPWRIDVEGNFEGLLPEGNTLSVNATILVEAKDFGSPDRKSQRKGKRI